MTGYDRLIEILHAVYSLKKRVDILVNQLLQTWEYMLIFILGAIPMLEILVVIPLAIAAGLSPVLVVAAAFAGNTVSVWIFIIIYEKLESWWAERKRRKSIANESQGKDEPEKKTSKRKERAKKIWDNYGLPGLAFLAPALTGAHLAVIIALAFKSSKRAAAIWITVSLAVWSVGLGIVSYYGLSLFDWF